MIEVLGEGLGADRIREFLDRVPQSVQRAGYISSISLEDRGVSMPYYPNNGYYSPDERRLVLGNHLLTDPRIYMDGGKEATQFEFILAHEIGHGVDEQLGLPSTKDPWCSLSGWKQNPDPGMNRLVIRDSGQEKVGEWFYADGAEFPRYYGRTNPWDDFADCYAFYVLGLDGFLPEAKRVYMQCLGGIERFK